MGEALAESVSLRTYINAVVIRQRFLGFIMERRPLAMNKANMIGWTERSKRFVREQAELAKRIAEDTNKQDRLAKQNCKCCFYGSRIGGAAMTTQACMCCHKPVMYGSTANDALCVDA